MTDKSLKAVPLYIVSEFRNGQWHDIEATRDEARAREVLEKLADKGRIKVLEPRAPKWP